MEVGDGNPIGRVVNVFLIVLIIANGLAFAAETVSSVYAALGRLSSRRSTLLGDRLHRRICAAAVEFGRESRCFTACRIGARG